VLFLQGVYAQFRPFVAKLYIELVGRQGMKTKQIMGWGLLLVVGTGLMMAQNPSTGGFAVSEDFGPPDPATMAQHHVQMLTRVLSLTSDQQKQALTVYTNAETSATDLHATMRTAHEALQTAVKGNDANGISQAATTIGSLTAEMTTIHAKADAAFYLLLTPDQQTKYSEFGPKTVFFDGGHTVRMGGPPN
jgi:Spy/CpxP family protein refolding chaperone